MRRRLTLSFKIVYLLLKFAKITIQYHNNNNSDTFETSGYYIASLDDKNNTGLSCLNIIDLQVWRNLKENRCTRIELLLPILISDPSVTYRKFPQKSKQTKRKSTTNGPFLFYQLQTISQQHSNQCLTFNKIPQTTEITFSFQNCVAGDMYDTRQLFTRDLQMKYWLEKQQRFIDVNLVLQKKEQQFRLKEGKRYSRLVEKYYYKLVTGVRSILVTKKKGPQFTLMKIEDFDKKLAILHEEKKDKMREEKRLMEKVFRRKIQSGNIQDQNSNKSRVIAGVIFVFAVLEMIRQCAKRFVTSRNNESPQ